MNEFLHRAIGIPQPIEDNGDLITTLVTEDFHQTLLLAKADISDLSLTCTQDAGDFKEGVSYAVCQIAMRGMCVVDSDGDHQSIPREVIEKYFVLRTTRSRLDAIRGLARAALDERTERLETLAASFLKRETFAPGNLVRWKPGLRNKVRPLLDETGVVIEVRDRQDREAADPSSSDAGGFLDVVVAVLDEDGDFLHFPLDGRRLERVRR